LQISGIEALSGIVCHGRVSFSHGLGREHGRIATEMLGLASTAMGLWEISTGLSGLGASVSAEFIGYGVGSIAAVPIAAGSFALIGKGVAEVSAGLALWKNADQAQKNNNPFDGPVDEGVVIVDEKGNAIPVKKGNWLTGSKNGKWLQEMMPGGPKGVPSGLRKDGGGHPPPKHTNPKANNPHAHVPGITNLDGTEWLPLREP